MVRGRVQVDGAVGLQRALDQLEDELFKRLRRSLRGAAVHGRSAAIALARRKGLRARGEYEAGFGVEQTADGAILKNTARHAGVIENGRRRGARPPPVDVILRWMIDKGLVGRIPIFRGSKGKAPVGEVGRKNRPRIRALARERVSQSRLSKREQYVLQAWRRAWSIARAISIRGLPAHRIVGDSITAIDRFIRAEIRRIARGE